MELEDNRIGDVIEGEDRVDTWSFFNWKDEVELLTEYVISSKQC